MILHPREATSLKNLGNFNHFASTATAQDWDHTIGGGSAKPETWRIYISAYTLQLPQMHRIHRVPCQWNALSMGNPHRPNPIPNTCLATPPEHPQIPFQWKLAKPTCLNPRTRGHENDQMLLCCFVSENHARITVAWDCWTKMWFFSFPWSPNRPECMEIPPDQTPSVFCCTNAFALRKQPGAMLQPTQSKICHVVGVLSGARPAIIVLFDLGVQNKQNQFLSTHKTTHQRKDRVVLSNANHTSNTCIGKHTKTLPWCKKICPLGIWLSCNALKSQTETSMFKRLVNCIIDLICAVRMRNPNSSSLPANPKVGQWIQPHKLYDQCLWARIAGKTCWNTPWTFVFPLLFVFPHGARKTNFCAIRCVSCQKYSIMTHPLFEKCCFASSGAPLVQKETVGEKLTHVHEPPIQNLNMWDPWTTW